MRKMMLALTVLVFTAGLVVSAEVTLVKFDPDKKEVTVKEGEAEKTYRITEKTKFLVVDPTGIAKEVNYSVARKGLASPTSPGKMKFDITTDKGVITEAKMRGRKKN